MPFILPFLVHKYKTFNPSHIYTRRQLTATTANSLAALRAIVQRALSTIVVAGAGAVGHNFIIRRRNMFYYIDRNTTELATDEGRRKMAMAMVIPFMCFVDKVNEAR